MPPYPPTIRSLAQQRRENGKTERGLKPTVVYGCVYCKVWLGQPKTFHRFSECLSHIHTSHATDWDTHGWDDKDTDICRSLMLVAAGVDAKHNHSELTAFGREQMDGIQGKCPTNPKRNRTSSHPSTQSGSSERTVGYVSAW